MLEEMKLTKAQKQKIKELAQKYNLKLALIFGSQVLGQLNTESDIDVAFLSENKLSAEKDCYLNYEFTNIFKNDRVDTVDLKLASPLLLKEIIGNCQIIYQSDALIFDYFEVYVLQRFREAKPLFKLHQEAIRRFVGLAA